MKSNDKPLALLSCMRMLLLGLLLTTLGVHAQIPTSTFQGCKQPIKVVFINGVNTDVDEAVLHLANFQKVAPKATPSGRPLIYKIGYNYTNGALFDVGQAVRQKYQQYTGFLTLYEAFSIFVADTVANSSIIGGIPLGMGVQIQQDAEAFRKTTFVNSLKAYVASAPDLRKIYDRIKETTPTSQALLLLGHSQGNLFANQLYELLLTDGFKAAALTTVGVATPTHTMRGSLTGEEQYVTNRNDELIENLRTIDPLTLRPNVVGAVATDENSYGHGFSTSYLGNSNTRGVILKIFSDALGALRPECNPPPVEVTLNGTQAGWTVSPKVTLSGLVLQPRSLFFLQGSPGNTCGGERGGPLYSLDSAIDVQADFFGAPVVQGAPFMDSPNRRPCSSFVAVRFYPDPSDPNDLQKSKPRFWINATARAESFFGGFAADREYQLRIDTGDPFKAGLGFRCDAGTVPNPFAGWFRAWSPTSCTARFVAQ